MLVDPHFGHFVGFGSLEGGRVNMLVTPNV